MEEAVFLLSNCQLDTAKSHLRRDSQLKDGPDQIVLCARLD